MTIGFAPNFQLFVNLPMYLQLQLNLKGQITP